MIKAMIFFVLGAGATYLYLNPGDVDGMMMMGREGVNTAATMVMEATK